MTDHAETPTSTLSGSSRFKECFKREAKLIAKWGPVVFLTPIFAFNSGISIFTTDLADAQLTKCIGDVETPAEELGGRALKCAMWVTSTPGLAIGKALDKN